MAGEDLGLGDAVRLTLYGNERVVSSLIKHVFFRTFRREHPEVMPLSFYPFRILSRKDEDDMVAGLLPGSLKGVLSRKKQFEVHFRDIIQDGSFAFGAVVNLRYRWIFSETCSDLQQEGFDLIGKQVLLIEELPNLAGVIAPDESLVGPITSIEGSRATVETNEGEETYSLSDLHLHRSFSNIEEYLIFKLGERKTDRILEQVDHMDRTRLDAQYYFGEVERMAGSLSRLEYRNKDGFTFSISSEPAKITNSFRIHDHSFLFDYNPGASDTNASRGLTEHGPYDSSTFDVKHPKVLAVLHENHRGGFADFLGKLKSGIPHSRTFKSGLVGKYRLHDVTFETVELGNYGVREYAEKIADYIREQDTLPDLAVVETKEEFRQLPSQANPYYWVKAYLLSLGIPVQFIKNKNVRKPDNLLQSIVLSKGLGDLEKHRATGRFLDSFNNRIAQIAFVLWIALVLAITVGTLYLGYRYLNAPKQERGTFENILALLPLLGVPGLLGLIGRRRQIEAWLKRRLLQFFKYPGSA
jgi:hypothetical protein